MPALTEFVLDDFLPYQLTVLANRLSDGFSRTYQQKFDISVSEWRVVAHLSQAEKVSIREIYKRIEMDKSKASRAAARLEAAGYITKRINPADRRLVELSLTPKGHAMSNEIVKMGLAFQAEVQACLPAEHQRGFAAAINLLLENCK